MTPLNTPLPSPDRTQRQAARQRWPEGRVTIPAWLLADREAEIHVLQNQIDALTAENQILAAQIRKLEGPDWSLRDSITY